MERIARQADAVLRTTLIACMIVLVACVTWQVASRYLLDAPSTVTDEVGRFTLMWFALLAAAYVLGQRRHLAIDLLAGLPIGPAKRMVAVTLTLLVAAFALALLAGGWLLATDTLSSGQVTPTLRLRMGYVYFAVPVSALLMLIYCGDILRTALGPKALGPNDPVDAHQLDELLEGD